MYTANKSNHNQQNQSLKASLLENNFLEEMLDKKEKQ